MLKKTKQKANSDPSSDSRVQRSKQTVLTTTYELLTKEGFAGVTVDAVSERSGVAKTTIYRHWPSRSALLIAACSQLGCRFKVPDTGSLRDDLIGMGIQIAEQLRVGPWAAALPSVIDAAERDSELAELLSAMHEYRMSLLSQILEQGRRRGELSAKSDVRELAACIYGPMFYRRWFSREPLTERFLEHVVESAIGEPTSEKK